MIARAQLKPALIRRLADGLANRRNAVGRNPMRSVASNRLPEGEKAFIR